MLIFKGTIIILTIHFSLTQENELPSEELSSRIEENVKNDNISAEEIPQQPKNLSPHVIIILADDLGWNDVSFHGSSEIRTPNIDALAANAIILNSYYTESHCAPSRASLMSGLYPIHLGLQNTKLKSGELAGLSLDVKIMPEYFKSKGYSTYMVGKWHLGYFKKEYTPTSRGFDSFIGFYNEQIDYFDYTNYQTFEESGTKPFYGIDFQDGTSPIKNFRGRYATNVFSEKAVNFIQNHNDSNPLFLYMAHLAPHSGNVYLPLQAPLNHVSKNAHIQDPKRQIYAGVISALDDSVGELIDALNQRGFLNNSIIVFASDNGGLSKSSNRPLRGGKWSSWEGGVRVPCFIWSPLLNLQEPRTSDQLMHVTDWLPTLYAAVGGDIKELGKIDGFNMWKSLVDKSPSPRLEILHNIDPISNIAALRRGDYKLIDGMSPEGNNLIENEYDTEVTKDMNQPTLMDDYIFTNDTIVKKILEESNLWLVQKLNEWREKAVLSCEEPQSKDNRNCEPNKSPCLFNIAADPCEYTNLAAQYPRVVRSMMRIIKNYKETAVEPQSNGTDPRADPRCHGFSYVPWLDEEYNLDCSYM